MERKYLCIDLKSFYASVECIERGLDPLTTNLVVADASRTEKTICLAVTPALKSFGVSGRARLFEVVQKVRDVNRDRKRKNHGKVFAGKSYDAKELAANSGLELSYIIAPPRMAHYIKYSTDIYKIYLKYVAPEDIHVYSIDEVFIDITNYLKTYKMSAHDLAMTMIRDVLKTTGITATAGIGTNMYLAKIAMDITAKKMPPDKDGVRIAELDEMSYRRNLWDHRPITDFWRVGKGYARRLEANHLYTMGDIARCSITKYGENLLYKLFGVNAELLIDHAWGWEPCTIAEVRAYKPQTKSLGSGQVLHCPYDFEKARIIVREMTELLVLDMVEKKLVTNQIVLTVGYDIENLTDPKRRSAYKGEVTTDFYGRQVPKHAHGTVNTEEYTSSTSELIGAVTGLFDRIVDPNLLIRRINISVNKLLPEDKAPKEQNFEQLDLFTDYESRDKAEKRKKTELKKEKSLQKAMINLKNRYGKNAVLRGTNLREGATTIDRNNQIGGHKA